MLLVKKNQILRLGVFLASVDFSEQIMSVAKDTKPLEDLSMAFDFSRSLVAEKARTSAVFWLFYLQWNWADLLIGGQVASYCEQGSFVGLILVIYAVPSLSKKRTGHSVWKFYLDSFEVRIGGQHFDVSNLCPFSESDWRQLVWIWPLELDWVWAFCLSK